MLLFCWCCCFAGAAFNTYVVGASGFGVFVVGASVHFAFAAFVTDAVGTVGGIVQIGDIVASNGDAAVNAVVSVSAIGVVFVVLTFIGVVSSVVGFEAFAVNWFLTFLLFLEGSPQGRRLI